MIGETTDALLAAGKKEEALRAALDHVRKTPKEADGYLALADVYIEQEDYASATVAASDACRLQPRNAKVLETLGWLFLTDGNTELAEKHFTDSLAVDERNAFVWGNLGIIASMKKDHELAERRYKKAIAIDPDDATAWVNLGVTYTEVHRDADALEAFAHAKALKSKDARVAVYIDRIKSRADVTFGKLIPLPLTPHLFTVLVPEDWDSSLDGPVIRVQSKDKRSLLLITVREGTSASLVSELAAFADGHAVLQMLSPGAEEKRGGERIARMSFIAQAKEGRMFCALATHVYGRRIVEATFSSSHPYSETLASAARSILDSLSVRTEMSA